MGKPVLMFLVLIRKCFFNITCHSFNTVCKAFVCKTASDMQPGCYTLPQAPIKSPLLKLKTHKILPPKGSTIMRVKCTWYLAKQCSFFSSYYSKSSVFCVTSAYFSTVFVAESSSLTCFQAATSWFK